LRASREDRVLSGAWLRGKGLLPHALAAEDAVFPHVLLGRG
jgi:hypothetical protein